MSCWVWTTKILHIHQWHVYSLNWGLKRKTEFRDFERGDWLIHDTESKTILVWGRQDTNTFVLTLRNSQNTCAYYLLSYRIRLMNYILNLLHRWGKLPAWPCLDSSLNVSYAPFSILKPGWEDYNHCQNIPRERNRIQACTDNGHE